MSHVHGGQCQAPCVVLMHAYIVQSATPNLFLNAEETKQYEIQPQLRFATQRFLQ